MDMTDFDNRMEHLFSNECMKKISKIKYDDTSGPNEAIQRIIN